MEYRSPGVLDMGMLVRTKKYQVQTVFLYTDHYVNYDFGAEHPLKIERLHLAFELCKSYGHFDLIKSL